jgi:hypothetical protein
VDLLCGGSEASKSAAVRVLGIIITMKTTTDDTIKKAVTVSGAIPPLLALLPSQDCEAWTMHVLYVIASCFDPTTAATVAAVMLPLLVALLHGCDEEYMAAALMLDVLAGVSNTHKAAIAKAGALPALMRGGEGDDMSGQFARTQLLVSLAGGDGATATAVVEAGVLPLLVELICGDSDAARALGCCGNVKQGAARALGKLAVANAANMAAVVEAGAIPLVELLVELLGSDSHKGSVVTVWALWNIGADKVAIAMEDDGEAGDIRLLVDLLRGGADAAQLEQHGHILWLVWVLEDGTEEDEDEEDDIRLDAAKMIKKLMESNDTNRAAFTETRVIPAMVELLRFSSTRGGKDGD